MTVCISGGITNVPNFKERFKKAERHLRELGFDVINPAGLQDSVAIGDFTHTEMRLARLLNKKIVKEDEERVTGKRVWSGCN